MEDLSSKISEVLSDPEALEKIKLIASSLSAADTNTQTEFSESKVSEPSAEKTTEDNQNETPSFFSSIDPTILLKIGSVLSQTHPENDKNIKLMNSIKPYLSQKRATKIDTALQMLKIGKFASAFLKDTDLLKNKDNKV